MKFFRVLVIAVVLLVVVGLSGWFVIQWRQAVVTRQDASARERTATLLAEGRAQDAVTIIRRQPHPFRHPDWIELELRALTDARAVHDLNSLYQRNPDVLLRSEDASFLLLRVWLADKNSAHYEQLRTAWYGREKSPARWKLLDADTLLWAGKKTEAAELLQNEKYSGHDEAGRLLRLALAVATQDRNAAWNYLSQANTADPRNPDIHSFRAQLLETTGRTTEARVEYVAAVLTDPANPLLRDQLAEFYRRQGSLDLALKTWQDALQPPSLDYIWVKALFWSRVVQPSKTPLPLAAPGGSLAPLVALMRETPCDRFYPSEKLGSDDLMHKRPESFWLAVLEHLRAGRESDALKMLERGSISTRTLQQDLNTALRQILIFRKTSVMPIGMISDTDRRAGVARHAFFNELEKLRQPPNYMPSAQPSATLEFLKGPHAFAAACLAAGWREAALSLSDNRPIPPDAPEWYVYALAQALRYNRSPEAALSLLATQPATPLLDMLSAEMMLLQKHLDEGCERLTPLISRQDDIGFRAAWLLAVTRLEQSRRDEVLSILVQQPALARSVTGREIKARVELSAGHDDKAEILYRAISKDSIEARVWLAKRAILRKDWNEARKLTQELMALMPEEMEIRQSLVAIEAAARKP